MYLSIDFEDFNHDLKRSLGIWKTGCLKSDVLWEKYNLINEVFKKSNSGKGSYGTFFCTGIIAKKEPALIKKIADDGHEIACHYYFHDVMTSQSLKVIEKNILKAKNILQDTSNKKVGGFRAPYFAIEKNNSSHYKILEKFFDYDSSFSCTTKKELNLFKTKMGLQKLKIIPVFQKNIANFNLKLGGSFIKLFPKLYMDWMINQSKKNQFVPHIYLHPYEFGNSEKLRVNRYDLKVLGITKSNYWRFRQYQWIKFRNNSLERKVESLIRFNKLDGLLSNFEN